MNRTPNPATLPSDTPEHEQRIAAIRERAQRHAQRSARLFAHPPEPEGSDLPVPSLLAVACSVALANQAQAQATQVSNDAELRSALWNSTNIELTQDISLTSEQHIGYSGTNIDGKDHTIELNKNRALWNLGYARNIGNISDVTFKNGAHLTASTANGGVIDLYHNYDISGDITSSHFLDSSAGYRGGAIYANNINGSIKESSFVGNSAGNLNTAGSGGAIHTNNDIHGDIVGTTFGNNTARYSGGAIFTIGGIKGTIRDSHFINNTSTDTHGGALYITNDLEGGIENSIFTGNTAKLNGGVIDIKTLTGGIRESKFTDNHSETGTGGAVWVYSAGGVLNGISDSIFKDNSAGGARGGGAVSVGGVIENGIQGSTFENNKALVGEGGAINAGAINGGITSNSKFENNTALTGGAIFLSNGAPQPQGILTGGIDNSKFIGNTATDSGGGAIHLHNGILQGGIKNGTEFSKNTAAYHGGAIWLIDLQDGISNSKFIENKTLKGIGGAITASNIDGGITGSHFEKNNAHISGGALYAGTLNGAIDNSIFEKNSAVTSGGGAIHVGSALKGGIKNNSQFTENTAKNHGGAVWVTDFKGGISESIFTENISEEGAGGALWVRNTIEGSITNSTFQNNKASGTGVDDGTGTPGGGTGGAIRTNNIEGGIDGSHFIGNTSNSGGGAIHLWAGTLNGGINNTEFKENTTNTGHGGAIWTNYLEDGINGSTFTENKALAGSGGAIKTEGAISGGITGSTFTKNTATDQGGAVWAKDINGNITGTTFDNNTTAATGSGGAILVSGIGSINGSIIDSTFSNNSSGDGGAFRTYFLTGDIDNTQFIGNTAHNVNMGGGAIHSNQIYGGIKNGSVFEKNITHGTYGGGAIWTDTINGGISDSEFNENKASNVSAKGGAINAQISISNGITDSVFKNNSAGATGGAISVGDTTQGSLSGGITRSHFEENTAVSGVGGAVRAYVYEGGIHDSKFINNEAGTRGGALDSATWINGGITSGSVFSGNTAESHGGAIYAVSGINGGISDTTFEKNTSTTGRGGAIWAGSVTGEITGSTFSENSAKVFGGALYFSDTTANNTIINSTFSDNKAGDMGAAVFQETGGTLNVSDSRFLGNIAQYSGGAIKSDNLSIKNSAFIGNQGVDNSGINNSATGLGTGLGGAILIQGQLDIENSVFLGNRSAYRGAAIHHHHDNNGTTQTIRIAGDADKTLFYGNQETDTGRYSSIEFSHTRDNLGDVTIHADKGVEGNSGVLMLDAMQSVNNPAISYSAGSVLNIKKSGDGDWFLGGDNRMIHPGAWTINQGRLALTDVNYDGSGAEQAQINLTDGSFSLNNGAVLEGQGTISAKEINLSGTINPNMWRNTGMLAKDITTGITQADIDSIQTETVKDGFATITLDTQGSGNAVKMDGATYEVGVAWKDDGAGGFTAESDLLDVKGALEVTNNSGINITRLDFDQNWALARIQGGGSEPAAQVIKTTDGINGAFNVKVAGGLAPSSDFLKVRGEQVGNDYEVRLGLAWFSKERDGSRTAVSGDSVLDAHGGFTVDTGGSFTIGGALEKRTDVPNFINETTEAGGAPGWDGNSLTKRGDGTLILNGDNTYDGLTKIDGGTLVLGDSTANAGARVGGDVQINNGAIFDGHGRAKGDVIVENGGQFTGFGGADGLLHVKNGGLLAPGNATTGDMGTVDAGRLQIDAGGTYRVKTDASGGTDLVNVANDATLHGGTVEVNAKDGNWGKRGTQHTRTIIQSGGPLTGKFDNVTSDLAFLTPNLDYNNNQVILGLTRNSTKMEDIADGSTRNRINTAEGLGHLEGSGANPTLINELLGLNKDDALRAFDSLSGEIYPTTSTVLLHSSRQLRTRISTRLTTNTQGTSDAPSFNAIRTIKASDTGNSTPVWVSAWGHTGNQGRTPNAARADISGNGVLVGIDNTDRPGVGGLHAGVMFGSERTKVDIADDRNSRSEVDSRSVGLYGGSTTGDTQWRGGLIYSGLDVETQRTVTVNSLTERVSAERKGKQMQAFAEVSHNLTLSERTSVAPWMSVAKVWQRLDPTTESTGASALEIEKQSAAATLTSVGGRGQMNFNGAVPVALYADVGYQHVIDSKNNDSKHHFAGQTQDFAVRGTTLNDTLVSGVGVQLGVGRNSALLVEYRGEFGSGQKQHMGNISWQVKF